MEASDGEPEDETIRPAKVINLLNLILKFGNLCICRSKYFPS